MPKGKILIAPLNWGLGHAARCVPLIKALIENGFIPILASDGQALLLLQKEFPSLQSYELPSYHISYPKKPSLFKLKMLWDSPKFLAAINREKAVVDEIHDKEKLCGIISDNRLGVKSGQVPSIIITHQLNVLSGKTSFFSSSLHQYYIAQFDECWIPDVPHSPSLSGKLGHLKKTTLNLKYLGVLSRISKTNLEKKFDIMVLLSGPEPQRSMLENILYPQLQHWSGKQILFVRGVVEKEPSIVADGHIKICNFLTSQEIERAMNQSAYIICRSGYTTLMDLAALNKKAFLIPTPGQYEQMYLAKRLDKKGILPFCEQHEFNLNHLKRLNSYEGLGRYSCNIDWSDLFVLFKRK